MPLPRYGVVIGRLRRFARDDSVNFGDYYHAKMFVASPTAEYECVIDFVSPFEIEVRYRVVRNLSQAHLSPILALPDGYHNLAKTPDSGALDFIRSSLFGPWVDNPGRDGLEVLEKLVRDSTRIFVFGEPWRHGRRRGMHSIHYNQGDPPGPHRHDNGIWQDGGTIVQREDGELIAFLTRFASQSLATDERGLAIHV